MVRAATVLALATFVSVFTGCTLHIGDGYSFDYRGATAKKTEQGLLSSEVKTIVVDNRFGDVSVVKSEGDATWNWNATCWATEQSAADDFLANLKLNVATTDTQQSWRVTLPEDKSGLRGVKSNLALMVPADVTVKIQNEHGDIQVADITGPVSVANQHGDTTLATIEGKTQVLSQHGEVTLKDLAGECAIDSQHGDIRLDAASSKIGIVSQHGDVRVMKAGHDVTINSQHGDIAIETAGENVTCQSQHGEVSLTMTNNEFVSIGIITQHADARLVIPENIEANIDVDVEHGDLKSDFSSNEDSDAPQVRVRTQHGDVRITKG